jgi:hypothetical protein
MLRVLRFAAIASLAFGTVVVGASAAGAATGTDHQPVSVCKGTLASPGVLAGTFHGNVVVIGACAVNGGAAVIRGDLILTPGSVLNAMFALDDVTGKGTSSLSVFDDVSVGSGAVLAIGCEPNFNPCLDDPNASKGGTLTGQNHVFGSVSAWHALAVLLHASTIYGNVTSQGGGGGVTCAVPKTGVFHLLKSPVFSDAEDNNVGGSVSFTGLRTCWLGALRNYVRGSVVDIGNTMADPDANEFLANVIRGNIVCFANSPAVQYGDSMSSPNKVRGQAFGECAFGVRQPDPSPHGRLRPISIKV